MDIDIFLQQITKAKENNYDAKWITQRLIDATNILQQTQIYMERRFRQLSDYVYKKGFRDFSKFLKIKEEEKLMNFRKELKIYCKKHEALFNPTGDATLELNKWLSDHINLNPLEDED